MLAMLCLRRLGEESVGVDLGVEVADTFLRRLVGLLGRAGLPPGNALLIRPCSSVHTCFMRFPIDVVFVDSDLTVLRVAAGLKPWRMAWCPGAAAVLEMGAGEAALQGLRPGARLALVER